MATIKSWVEGYDEVKKAVGEVELMPEFIEAGLTTESEAEMAYSRALELVEKLELRNMLSGEEDKMGAIVARRPWIGLRCCSECTPDGARPTATK